MLAGAPFLRAKPSRAESHMNPTDLSTDRCTVFCCHRAFRAGTTAALVYCCLVLPNSKEGRSMEPRQLRLPGFTFARMGTPRNSCWNLRDPRELSPRTSDPQISVMKTRNADESRRSALRRGPLDREYGSPVSHQRGGAPTFSEHRRRSAGELEPP